ncbi:MAG: extracellular solute-binding protein family 1 [Paenibacillaceae bacterium]|nr:extracellular solute-binding protein family 1 [Paenibacillaceae bacterium]
MKLTKMVLLLLSTIVALAVAGCAQPQAQSGSVSDSGEGNASAKPNNEPFNLVFFTARNGNYADEGNFQNEIGQFIKEKFPNVTVEHIHRAKGQDYPDLLASGKNPDIILESSMNVQPFIIDNGFQTDLAPLMKKHNFDVTRIDPSLIDQLKNSGDGKLYGLPFNLSSIIGFYNKDIFDKFGFPYPKDGVTWDDVYDLAKKMTRDDGGTQYNGLLVHYGLMFKYNQLSLPFLDTKSDKAIIATDAWRRMLENFKRFYDIPGMPYTNKVDDFPLGKTAIAVHVAEKMIGWPQVNPALNWDAMAAPTFKEAPKTGFQPNTYALFVTSVSKHKDEAFDIIAYLLSDEVQMKLSRKGLVTPLTSKQIQQAFAQDQAELKGKNVQAVFYNKYPAALPLRAPGLAYLDLSGETGKALDNVMKNKADINTALRQAEEESNQLLAEKKAQSHAK